MKYCENSQKFPVLIVIIALLAQHRLMISLSDTRNNLCLYIWSENELMLSYSGLECISLIWIIISFSVLSFILILFKCIYSTGRDHTILIIDHIWDHNTKFPSHPYFCMNTIIFSFLLLSTVTFLNSVSFTLGLT